MTLLSDALVNSVFDEESWGSDIFLKSSLFKVQNYFYSAGTIASSLDHDYYQLQVVEGSTYTLSLTSDAVNYGWNTYVNSQFIEFDLIDQYGVVLKSSAIVGAYDDSLTFTANFSGLLYVDVHGLVYSGADYALAVSTEIAQPTNTYYSSTSTILGSEYLNLTLTGTAAISGTGNSLNNTITGNSAANTLNGATGADSLIGGAGNDTYVTDGGDTITEQANAGTDTVQSSVAQTLGANVENLTLTGTGAISGTGNSLNNLIVGNGGANTLNGAAGVDSLTGGAGNDTFVFKSVAETTILATTADIITDFVKSQDKINLGAIDAFAGTSANDTFIWKGTAAFNSTTQGEVRYEKFNNSGTANDYTMVWIDNDRDTEVEMAIRLTGLHNLTDSDFVL